MTGSTTGRDAANQDFTFRYEVVPQDRDTVRAIVESTGFFYPPEVDVAVELVDERSAKGDASGYHFVFAERNGATVGYSCYGHIAGTQSSYDLYWLAVAKTEQGQGLGRLLMTESERKIHEAGGQRIYIETSNRPQYAPTRRFYDRCQYVLEALLKDFYGPGDDKAIYVRTVS